MYNFYQNQNGVQVQVRKDGPGTVRVHADGAVFYHGPVETLAEALAVVPHDALNPALVQFMQWVDNELGT